MKKILKYVIAILFGLVISVLVLVSKGTFVQTELLIIYKDLCDAFFIPGGIMVGFGLLIFVSNGGVFDMLKFGLIKLTDLFRRDLTKVKFRTFYDYRKAQEGKSRSFFYILLSGIILCVLAVIFLILYLNVKK